MPTSSDLQKEALAFANNIGGYLLIGIRAKRPENTPNSINGIQKYPNITEQLVDRVRNNSTPTYVVQPKLIVIPSNTNNCVVIIYCPESQTIHRASNGQYYYHTAS
jgi:predicted HTH transcriptional regulator